MSHRMQRLLVLNPNSTAFMTDRVVTQVQQQLHQVRPDVSVQGHTCDDGPPVIDTPETFEAGAAAAVQAWARCTGTGQPPDALLLACFGDPGLETLRTAAAVPVVGLAEAAMAAVAGQGLRFAILTAGPAWVPMLTQRAHDFGHGERLAAVMALPVSGRELAQQPQRWQPALQHAAEQAQRLGAQALVLGGAAFAGLGPLVASPLPVFDGLEEATRAVARVLSAPPSPAR